MFGKIITKMIAGVPADIQREEIRCVHRSSPPPTRRPRQQGDPGNAVLAGNGLFIS